MDEKTIRTVLSGYKIHNCEVMIREDVSSQLECGLCVNVSDAKLCQITVDEFIDVLLGTRKYIPCLYVLNKIDGISLEECDRLAHLDHHVVISCEVGLK
jgi:ribosome-interacting GTPase 1